MSFLVGHSHWGHLSLLLVSGFGADAEPGTPQAPISPHYPGQATFFALVSTAFLMKGSESTQLPALSSFSLHPLSSAFLFIQRHAARCAECCAWHLSRAPSSAVGCVLTDWLILSRALEGRCIFIQRNITRERSWIQIQISHFSGPQDHCSPQSLSAMKVSTGNALEEYGIVVLYCNFTYHGCQ